MDWVLIPDVSRTLTFFMKSSPLFVSPVFPPQCFVKPHTQHQNVKTHQHSREWLLCGVQVHLVHVLELLRGVAARLQREWATRACSPPRCPHMQQTERTPKIHATNSGAPLTPPSEHRLVVVVLCREMGSKKQGLLGRIAGKCNPAETAKRFCVVPLGEMKMAHWHWNHTIWRMVHIAKKLKTKKQG